MPIIVGSNYDTRLTHDLFYGKAKFVNFSIEKGISMDFSETIEACVRNVGRCRQLNEKMKVCEYSRSRSYIDRGPRSFTYKMKTFFSQKPLGQFLPNLVCKILDTRNENL